MDTRTHSDPNAAPADKGSRIVLQADEGASYWQPRPANGYATVKVNPDNCTSNQVTMGIQVVAPGGYVREHWHARNEEILFCYAGTGTILVDGEPHPFVPGTTAFLGRWVKHKIVNEGPETLRFTWTFLPPGLDQFFAGIGRPRRPGGESPPEPFDRPADHLAVEGRTGFGPPIGS